MQQNFVSQVGLHLLAKYDIVRKQNFRSTIEYCWPYFTYWMYFSSSWTVMLWLDTTDLKWATPMSGKYAGPLNLLGVKIKIWKLYMTFVCIKKEIIRISQMQQQKLFSCGRHLSNFCISLIFFRECDIVEILTPNIWPVFFFRIVFPDADFQSQRDAFLQSDHHEVMFPIYIKTSEISAAPPDYMWIFPLFSVNSGSIFIHIMPKLKHRQKIKGVFCFHVQNGDIYIVLI